MLLPNIYGQGALFACSGMKCPTDYNNTLVGSLLGDKLGILLYLKKRRELFFELQPPIRDINYQAVTGDVIVAELSDGNKEYRRFFRMTFLDAYTIIGETCRAAYPVMWADRGVVVNEKDSVQTFSDEKEHTVLLILEEGIGTVRFSMGYSGHSVEEAILRAQNGMQACVKTVVDQNLDFYNHISCPTNDKLFARTYAKAFSVLRTNVMSAEGKIKGYWTTPNRVPHKNMWLWDSVFHALGWQYYDVSLAYRAIEAMLEIQYEDGLIPIMATPYEALTLTQPPLLAWGIWKLYERYGDQKLINNSYEKLKKYIIWNLTHRDSNKNFLFEWLTSATGSGESGADNSARFDLRKTMDCVDFSSFMAKEVQTLSKMAKLLGEKDDEKYYQELFNCIQKAVNELLWDEETKTFRDRFLDGTYSKANGIYNLMPLFAGIATTERAQQIVEKVLKNPAGQYTKILFASDSASEQTYGCDMWRGGTWINYNYLIIEGLRKYGYGVLAAEARLSSVKEIARWYQQLGCLFEYYDSAGETVPSYMPRKGPTTAPYDLKRKIYPVRDFGWTAALYIAMLNDLCCDYETLD